MQIMNSMNVIMLKSSISTSLLYQNIYCINITISLCLPFTSLCMVLDSGYEMASVNLARNNLELSYVLDGYYTRPPNTLLMSGAINPHLLRWKRFSEFTTIYYGEIWLNQLYFIKTHGNKNL